MGAEPRRPGLLLLTIGLLLALHNANRFSLAGIFGPLRLRFHGAYAAVGNLFSAYPLAYALSQIPVGYLADRVDPRRLILVGTVIATATGILIAFTDVYAVALGARLLAGISGALIYTPAMTFGIAAFPVARRGAAVGVAYVGVGLGTAATLAGLPALVQHLGLTGGLLVLAGFGAVMTAIAPIGLSLRRNVPRAHPAGPRLLQDPSFQALLGFSFLGFFTTYAILTWLPAYLSDAFGIAPTTAGVLSAIPNLSLTAASPMAGKLSDTLGRRPVLAIGAVGSVAAFVMLAITHSWPAVLVASIVGGVSTAMTTAPLFVFASERFGQGAAGLAVGMVNGVGQIGSSLSGVVFGPMLDWTGTFASIWWSCIPIALLRYALLARVKEPPR
jgi:predicted MFS family arabinose efflux permease